MYELPAVADEELQVCSSISVSVDLSMTEMNDSN